MLQLLEKNSLLKLPSGSSDCHFESRRWSGPRACQQHPTVLRSSPPLPLNCLVAEKGLLCMVPNVTGSRGRNKSIISYLQILCLNETELCWYCNKNSIKQIILTFRNLNWKSWYHIISRGNFRVKIFPKDNYNTCNLGWYTYYIHYRLKLWGDLFLTAFDTGSGTISSMFLLETWKEWVQCNTGRQYNT